MKKLLLALCLCALALNLAACRKQADETPENPGASTSGQAAEPPVTPDTQETPKTPDTPDAPAADPNAIPFFDCGKLELPNSGAAEGRENFEEFLNLTGVGREAAIEITQYTVEGDPIVSTLTFDGGGFTLAIDSTADAFAAPADRTVRETGWKRLAIVERTGENGTLYQCFRLTNLDEGEVTGETPDGDDVYTLFEEPLTD